MDTAETDVVLEMRDIGMKFGQVWVLRHVDLTVRAGSIHALVGHNGAGKSTLMKIALGGYAPTEGTVRIGDAHLTFTQPAEARRLGLGMVLQELSLATTLPGLDNIFLNAERVNRLGLIERRAQTAEARALCRQLGVPLAVLDRRVSEMTQLEQELVEIAKAMRLARTVLILDEPTAPLTSREVTTLFAVIRRVARLGTAIVLITHHLSEVFAVADEVTALREGSVTLSARTAETSMSEVIEAMLGHRLLRVEQRIADEAASTILPSDRDFEPVLEVRDLRVGDKFAAGISFQVYPGEILGIAGLAGTGRTTLLRTLFGDIRPTTGEIRLRAEPYRPDSPAAAIGRKVFLIPENRAVHGLVLIHSIVDNMILPVLRRMSNRAVLRMSEGREIAQRMMSLLGIRARGPQQIVGELSGGNQQKVVLAKALTADARLLLLDEPTFGVDVGAASDLIGHVRSVVGSGNAALWVTSDFRELLDVADRVMILTGDGIQRIVKRGEPGFDEASLLRAVQRDQAQALAATALPA